MLQHEIIYKAHMEHDIQSSLGYFIIMLLVCHHVVDPLHNLFLGIAKHTINTWKKLSILKDGDFYVIQERVDSLIPPAGIGRIPRKIGSAFSSFTTDEWKHWKLLYSVHVSNHS